MDVESFHNLLGEDGQAAIAGAADLAPTKETFLACLTQLQKRFSSSLAKAALETVILRDKARAKFSRAGSMYFTRPALEMASGEIISRYRAERFAPFKRVADLCCGLGGDTIGLASPSLDRAARSGSGEGVRGWGRGGGVTAVDVDPLHLALARANLDAYNLHADFVEADLTKTPPPQADAYFFDPGRRAENRRLFSVRDYHPPLSLIDSWLPKPLGVKISPGVNLAELAGYDCEIEFISLDGDLKEATLWFGPLKTAARRATILKSSFSLLSPLSLISSSPPLPVSLSPPLAFLYEPDPAILRAGLVTTLAGQIGARQLDPDIAYLTSDALTPTPFARAFALEAAMPFSQKRLREKLRAMNVGRVTVKKRGSPLDPDDFARSLKLKGDEERIVFLTHVNGKPWVLIGRNAS